MKQPNHLTCEYQTNPLGIDTPHPRFSWWLNDLTPNARQTAYQIRTDNGWDTGKVKSSQSVHVPYKGPALNSRQLVTWQVRYWNARGKPSAWSKPAWFEMGLLAKSDWQAQWIGAPWVGGPKTTSPAPFLAKSFPITKSIWSARLYVTALGLYECTLNGNRVGDAVFTPGWTDYRKRIQYQVYDVTGHLRTGRNQFDAILGDGWAVGHVAWNNRQWHADRPQLFAQLEITFTDGSQATIVTDNTWQTAQGPILEADMLMGESYDARLKPANWQPALIFDAPSAPLVAMRSPPVRRIMEIKPISAPRKAGDKWIFDLGQNMVGRVRLRIRGNRGQTVTLRFAEVLNPDGTIYTTNLRAARATDHYTLAGKGTETWEPRFTFHGFRYVEVGGLTEMPKPDMITGIVLHSDTPPTGEFSCSDKLINQLQHNIQWGQRGNFLEVPTDCPQRDERCGWTGDAQVFSRTAAFNMDVAGFFTKWQNDLADAQKPNGDFTSVAPDVVLGKCGGGPAWSDAGVICPWTMYLSYGDTRLLAEHYDSMRRFIDSLRKESKNLIRAWDGYHWQGYGDWLAQDGSGTVFGGTRKDLIGTAFFAYSTRLLSLIAQRLGRKDDAVAYGKLFERIRRAFQRHFVTPQGLVGTGTQTSYVLALHFDLLPDRLHPVALNNLVRDIESRGKQSCGFVGSSYLPWVLSDNGRLDVAQRLLFQKDWPSWLYAVTQGATTIWERWDGWTKEKGFQDPGMNSFNHYAYGAVGAWLYAVVAGLQLDPEQPGYKHILIQPHPVGELSNARATLRTMYGIAESRWKISGNKFLLDITIPPNTTATVRLPGLKKTRAVGAGTHRFVIPWKK